MDPGAGWEGFTIFPSIYPSSLLDPSNCVMFVVHCSRLSPLNFCSLGSIVKDGVVDMFLVYHT